MHRELLLLGLLRFEDMHGYRLHEFIERELPTCTDLKKPTAYFLLDKLEQGGLIERYHAQAGNRPARRMYRLTERGESEFQRMLRESLASYTPLRFSTDIALAFADSLPPAEAAALLAQQRRGLQADLEAMRAVVPHQGSFQLLIDHRRLHLEADVQWLDQVIAQFQARAEASG